MDKSVNLHLTQFMSKVTKDSESIEAEWTPVRSLENGETPILLQKIVELEAEVIVNIIPLLFSCVCRQFSIVQALVLCEA